MTELWILVGLSGLLICIQILLIPLSPPGSWHWPRIYKVTITGFDAAPQSAFATILIAGTEDKDPAPAGQKEEAGKNAESTRATGPEAEKERLTSQLKAELSDDQAEADEAPERTLALQKSERVGLNMGDVIWVMDNYHPTPSRPTQFRLTAGRLLLEFPEPILILALLLILRLRKTRAAASRKEQQEPRERTVLRDDFHTRAQRFAEPKRPENEEA